MPLRNTADDVKFGERENHLQSQPRDDVRHRDGVAPRRGGGHRDHVVACGKVRQLRALVAHVLAVRDLDALRRGHVLVSWVPLGKCDVGIEEEGGVFQ